MPPILLNNSNLFNKSLFTNLTQINLEWNNLSHSILVINNSISNNSVFNNSVSDYPVSDNPVFDYPVSDNSVFDYPVSDNPVSNNLITHDYNRDSDNEDRGTPPNIVVLYIIIFIVGCVVICYISLFICYLSYVIYDCFSKNICICCICSSLRNIPLPSFIKLSKKIQVKPDIGTNIKTLDKNKYKIYKNEICSICLEDTQKSKLLLKCNHVFHKKCVQKWIKTCNDKHLMPKCPLCNTSI